MKFSPMYKLYDEENGWKWNPFSHANCHRKRDAESGKLTAIGEWQAFPYESARFSNSYLLDCAFSQSN